MSEEVLIKVEGLGKKFCKDLKKSLRYGVQDVTRSLIGKQATQSLRNGEFWALKDINFELKRGECLGLIGHNGAGKSTLLKVLNGLIKPDQGRVVMRGKVSALIELGAGFNPILTGRENIYNNASVLGFSRKEIEEKIEDIIDFSEIREFIDAPVQSYSSGMKVRLGFAVAAQMEPDVLIIDEVLAVGDLGFRTKCYKRINEMLQHSAVILVSHAMNQVSRACTQVLLMDKGTVQFQGKDISNGIDLYLDKFKTEEVQIIGDEKIFQIKDCQLFDSSSNDDFFYYGNKIKVRLNFKSNSPNIKKVCIMFSYLDQEHRYVAMSNSEFENQSFDVSEGKDITITAEFDNVFASGSYSFNIHFMDFTDGKGGFGLCTYQAYKNFKVKGSKVYTKIPIQFQTEWKTI